MNVQGEFTLKPQTIRQLLNHSNSKYNYLKHSKREHDFSLVLTKTRHSCVVACSDYPECSDTITIFGLCD